MIIIEQIKIDWLDISDGGSIEVLPNEVEISLIKIDYGVKQPFTVTMDFETYKSLNHEQLTKECEKEFNKIEVHNG